jgi:cleavage and polyadenylation specificity factor subunit 2
VLAIDWNHVKERHIDGSGVIDAVSSQAAEAAGTKRADLFVTSGAALDKVNLRRKDKDKRLLDLIHHTLTVSKSTLHLPVDASPRLLEILLLLDQHWAFSYPHARFPLCLVSRTGKEVLERARTMREWMGKSLQGEDAGRTSGAGSRSSGRDARDNAHGPLDFRFLRIFTSLGALDAALPAESPKIVLTVGPSLLYGPSLKFFRERVAPQANNTIVLTQKAEPSSVAQQLRSWWEAGQSEAGQRSSVGSELPGEGRELQGVIVRQRLPLQGQELEAYNEEERLRKEKDDQHKALLARSRQRLEADQEEESDDDDADDDKGDEDSDDDLDVGLPDDAGKSTADTLAGKKSRGGRKANGLPHDEAGDALGGEGDMTLLGSSLSHDIYLRGDSAHASNFFSALRGSADSNLEREAARRHGVGVRYRAAPVIEKRKRIDAFGEVVDTARWLSRGRVIDNEEASNAKGAINTASEAGRKRQRLDGEDGNDDLLQSQEDEDEYKDIPTKFMEEATNIAVRCNIVCIDLDGLIDGRALSIVLPQLAPRRLVLVGTPQPLSSALPVQKITSTPTSPATPTLRFIESLLGIKDFTREIFAPALGTKVSVGAEVHSFDVKLGEGVLEQLRISGWEDWGIAWLQARVTGASEDDVVGAGSAIDAKTRAKSSPASIALERFASGMDSTSEPQDTDALEADGLKAVYRPKSKLSAPSRVSDSGIMRHPTFFIGDVRLSKLKALLSAAHRIPSEFGGGGMLVCGAAALAQATGQPANSASNANAAGPLTANQAAAAVTVQKFGEKFILEGNAGRTFVKVRDVMYGMHARVGDV